ncbi:MAG: UDP-N-acetylmuramate:L-alanyl-gamma-D-glutamyl-meso-diaminopimelate ligase, partial [Ketobacter sp.]|nr:UDP-N-acetylmuramate:L-alanyl-gamma-D-glutamyl-meso-diaminopimelate ligase [Ketobacter sp.]
HPTAIDTTIDGLRKKVGDARIFAVLEPRSNTMKMGVHKQQLVDSWQAADEVLLFEPDNLGWSLSQLAKQSQAPCQVFRSVDAIIHQLTTQLQPGDHVLIMSNGGFGGIHQKLLDVLAGKA